MKSNFNQDLEVLKKIQAEMKTAMKSSTTQLEKNNSLEIVRIEWVTYKTEYQGLSNWTTESKKMKTHEWNWRELWDIIKRPNLLIWRK